MFFGFTPIPGVAPYGYDDGSRLHECNLLPSINCHKERRILNYSALTSSTFTAQTLYSGIFAIGSSAAIVNELVATSGKGKLA